jgi:Spy/CpxP family protein refolding chaperone
MRTKMKFKTIILSTAALFTLSSFAHSQTTPTESTDSVKQERSAGESGVKDGGRKNKRSRHRGGEIAMKSFRDLNLSDSQKTEMKTLRETYKAKFQPQREEMKGLAGKRRDGIITAEEEARFKSLRKEMNANGKSSHEAMMNILTTEQKSQLEQNRTEMREKMKQRRGSRKEKKPVTQEN